MVGFRPIFFALFLALLIPGTAAAETTTEIIVKRDPGLTAAERADIRTDAQVRLVETLTLARTELVAAKPGDVQDALHDLQADPDVTYAQLNHRRRAFAQPPDDPGFEVQWGMQNIAQLLFDDELSSRGIYDADSDVIEAWDQGATGDGQTVAVIDTGIANHQDINPASIVEKRNFVTTGVPTTVDGDGHGTHVAGTIAATADNNIGVAGVAPDAGIAALRALNNNGIGTDDDIAAAFDYAGANYSIVNASLGGPDEAEAIADAIRSHPNTLYVIAAGNDGRDNDVTPTFPCDIDEPNIICVGASTNRDERADFSNHGDISVDLFAPGEWILSTIPRGVVENIPATADYAFFSGTSMASPHVAAVAALALEADPTLSTDDLKALLLGSVDEKDALADSVTGGRLNAGIAVARAFAVGLENDSDGDEVVDAVDLCRNDINPEPGLPEGCEIPDLDADTVADWYDNCDSVDNLDQADKDQDDVGDACDGDLDGDGYANASDNCPTTSNSTQRDRPDGDGVGDACDGDRDNDGVPNTSDLCAEIPAGTANGCPASVTPTPQPADSDRDGVADASDACPSEAANTPNGCPLAQVTSLSARARKRTATVKVGTSRLATVRIMVERKKGRRWVRVARRTFVTSGNRATLKVSRLKRGTHRARISISSSAGSGTSVSTTFRVR